MYDNYYNNIVKFLGSGNPNSKYWFVGTEENWDLDKFLVFNNINRGKQIKLLEDKFSELGKNLYTFNEEDFENYFYNCKPKSFYPGIKSILEIIYKTSDKLSMKKIILGDVDKNNSEIFATNLISIGKNRSGTLSQECFVNNVFGVTIEKYQEDENRWLKELNQLWKDSKAFIYIFIYWL